ncbi:MULTISPECIES: FadR/GntR family transcriptional regulator [unclassified Agarivorans]|uniref:FadR/GntR family transcriptional regulator n=1 Tax=unclassified Agarivorans TaxID=2636026 RepID=UPI003D7CDC37
MASEFSTIEGAARSLHLQVAREVAKSILSGALAQHSIIPSEMELCEQFAVSRTALREAIKHLSSKGLLESRPKIGTRVRAREHWNMLDPQLLSWMSGLGMQQQAMDEFIALRQAIEPQAAALAAKNATSQQRSALTEAFLQMSAVAKKQDWSEWVEADLRFHRLIYLATGNCFFIPFANVLQVMYVHYFKYASQDGHTCMPEHTAIYQSIMAGDAEQARQANLALLALGPQQLAKGAVA